MKCPKCQFENPEDAKFCNECGNQLNVACPQCGKANPGGSNFCNGCGGDLRKPKQIQEKNHLAPQSHTPEFLVEKVPISKSTLEGERRHVTALFSDLSGYTSLSEKLDPEEVKGIMGRIFDQIAKVVNHHEGVIEKFIGDAVVAFFGTPIAHEDDPVRAIRAAREIHEIVSSISPEVESRIGRPLAMHTGINTGLVVTGGMNLEKGIIGVTGDTVNLASRLSGLARPGEIVVGEDTYHFSSGYFAFNPLTPVRVKGKAEPVSAYQVVDPREQRMQGLATHGISSPLVGRNAEVAATRACVNRLIEGQGSIFSLIGEAGLGKSRLMAEIRKQFVRDGSRNLVTWLEGRTLSYGQKISYWPFREVLRQYAGITEDDSAVVAWEKLENRVTNLFPSETHEILPYLASLLALDIKGEYADRIKYMDGESMGRQIFLSSRRFFERLAQQQPLVLVFEDLHWADESSTRLLEHLLPLVNRVPLLICGVSRPEPGTYAFRLREIAAREFERRFTEIRLAPLSTTEVSDLMCNLLEIENLPYRVRDTIIQKAEGNPFFIEEIMRSLMERGAVERDPVTGHWKAARGIEMISIPDTIQGVITARVDRLDEALKQVLRSASVIGRAFLYRILRGIDEAVQELDRHLDRLEGMELIREKQKIPELEYIFKHALVQESTYESILLQKRRQLHARVAQTIEALFPERLEEFYTMLAHHYAKGEVWDKAQEYLFKAGDQAGRIAADTEALAHYREAIETYARVFGDKWDPVQRASLERKMGEALYRQGDYPQATEYLQRALTYLSKPLPREGSKVGFAIVREILVQVSHRLLPRLLVRTTDAPVSQAIEEEARCYETIGWIDVLNNPKLSLLDCLKLLNSEKKGFSLGVVIAYMGIATVTGFLGLLGISYRYAHMAAETAEKTQHPVAVAYANFALEFNEYLLGRFDKAIEYGRIAADAYRKGGYWNLHLWGMAVNFVSFSLVRLGHLTEGLAYAQDLVRFGQDGNDPDVWCWGLTCMGFAQVRTGDFDKAVANLRQAIDLAERIPNHRYRVLSGSNLGWCYLRQGAIERALATLEQTQDYAIQHNVKGLAGFHSPLAEAYLLMGQRSSGNERRAWLKKARSTCRAAVKHGKSALRVQGIYLCLMGKQSRAQALWRRSIAIAEKRGMLFELGMTHFEAGKRLKDRAHLERAEAIFSQIGAEFDLAETKKLLAVGPT